MRVRVSGVGAWGPGFSNLEALKHLLAGAAPDEGARTENPVPACIPSRERRRAPLSVKLAVAVAEQACVMAEIDPAAPVSVFASGMGDMDITDYMCRTLASDTPLISPTKFHNSVHNAPVGYWSISQGARGSSNAVAAFHHTVPASLLEAVTQCVTEALPVLWACQDVTSPEPFLDIAAIPDACAFALLMQPADADERGSGTLEISVRGASEGWPALDAPALGALYAANPTARLLPVLYLLERGSGAVDLPLGPSLSLRLACP